MIMSENTNTMIKTFENKEFGNIRGLTIEGEPWFVGKDVAEALGYGDGNKQSKALSNALKDHIDEEDKKLLPYSYFKQYQNGDLKNISHYGATVINESGLYSLILSSKLPTAKKFKRWVTKEVLPSIRKTGGYVDSNRELDFLTNPNSPLYSYMNAMNKNIELLQEQVVTLNNQLFVSAPMVNTKALNVWKKSIATPMIDKVIEKHNVDCRNAYDLVYDVMLSKFGFSRANAITQFCDKYHCKETSTINAIADSSVYQSYFAQAANTLLDAPMKFTNNDTAFENDRNANNLTCFTINDDFDFVIRTLGEKFNDRSRNYSRTYGKIYSKMTTKRGWNCLKTRYHTNNKKSIILSDNKKFAKFINVCNKVLEEVIDGE